MTHLHIPKTISKIFPLTWSNSQTKFIVNSFFICCLYLVNIWLKFDLAIVFLDPYSKIITAMSYIVTFYSPKLTGLSLKIKTWLHYPTHILNFQKEKPVILLGHMFPSGIILPLHVMAVWLVTRSRWISPQEERGSWPRISLGCCRRSGHLEQQGTWSCAWVHQWNTRNCYFLVVFMCSSIIFSCGIVKGSLNSLC